VAWTGTSKIYDSSPPLRPSYETSPYNVAVRAVVPELADDDSTDCTVELDLNAGSIRGLTVEPLSATS